MEECEDSWQFFLLAIISMKLVACIKEKRRRLYAAGFSAACNIREISFAACREISAGM